MVNFKRLVPALAVSLFSLLVSVPVATAQSGTIIKPKKIYGERYAISYITAGTGSSGSPYTGWSGAITAGAGKVIFSANVDGSLTYYDVPDAGITVPSNVTIAGDGNAVLTWGTARASVNPMFTVAAASSHVTFEGLRFDAGVSVPAAGLTDTTGGSSFIAIGTTTAGTVTDITVRDNVFGVMRYGASTADGGNCGDDACGTDIGFLGSVQRVTVSGNAFDASASGTCFPLGDNSTQIVVEDVSFVKNKFVYSQTYHDFGAAINLTCGSGTPTLPTRFARITITENIGYNVNGFAYLLGVFENLQFTNNNVQSEILDFCLGVGGPWAATIKSHNLVVSGNNCSNDTTPHNGTLTTGNTTISVAGVNGFAITGNTVYGTSGDGFSSIVVTTSLNGTVSGNTLDPDRATTGGAGGPKCLNVYKSSSVNVVANACMNPGGFGFYVNADATTQMAVAVSGNVVEDTNATAAVYAGYGFVATCNGCSMIGNTQHTLTAPVGGMIYGAASADSQNVGFVGATLTYEETASGKFIGTAARAYGASAKFCAAGSATLPAGTACVNDIDCDPGVGFCTADALAVNSAIFAGDGINFEGTGGVTESPSSGSYTGQKNTHLGFTNPTAVRTILFPDASGNVALTVSALTPATLTIPNSTSLPGTCAVGDQYMDTDATTGQRMYLCESANTWKLQGDGGGTVLFSAISSGTNTTAGMVVGSGGTLTASGTGTIVATSIPGTGVTSAIAYNAANVSGTVLADHGGTGNASFAQGDLCCYSQSVNPQTLSIIGKSTSANRYLANTGTSNNPQWDQIDLGVAGSFTNALLATKGGTGLTVGTSGGVNYWASTTTQASSALLAANGIMAGGGAGATPYTSAATVNVGGDVNIPADKTLDIAAAATSGGSVVIREGADDGSNTVTFKVPDAGITADKVITFVTATGNLPSSAVESSGTNARCARFNASGILVPSAAGDCDAGGGGTGTVTGVGPGCTTGLCYTDATATAGTVMAVWEGTTSNANQININVPADPTAVYNLTIPDGTAAITLPIGTDTLAGKATTDVLTNKTLDAEGGGNVLTTVEKIWLPAAGCNNATPAAFWDLFNSGGTQPTPNCATGSNTAKGYLDFPDSDGDYQAQTTLLLPSDWTGTIDAKIKWLSAITTGSVVWQVATICVADAETDDPAFNAASTVTDAAKGTTNQTNDASITGVTITGCAAGELLHLKILRNRTHASDDLGASAARLIGVELTMRRAQ